MRVSSAVCAVAVAVVVAARTEAATISVPAKADLQAALTRAQPGDTIVLEQGATYVGNFTLPAKGGNAFITVETSPDGLPGEGARISPRLAPQLAKLRSPNGAPTLQTAPGAHHWRLVLLELMANAEGAGDIVALGDGSSDQSGSGLAHDLVVDRCYVHGDPAIGQKRGIALNSAATTITGSYISDIKAIGQDSQAICGWNGPGPFTITNNYLEASGENILFGGADPPTPNLVPSNITLSNNWIAKQPGWRQERWTVKNLVELKNARGVTIESNTIEFNWQSAQSGFGIMFTVRNQDGGCPWCQVADVVFQNNNVLHSAGGVSILGFDDQHPSQQTHGITIRNNLFSDIDNDHWGGNGYFLQLVGGARDITLDHNTIIQDHAFGIAVIEGPPILGFTFTNNLSRQNTYGIIGSDHGPGADSISAYLPASLIRDNVIADADPQRYPANNSFPTSSLFRAQFVSYARGNFRLTTGSSWRRAGTDGQDLGADLTKIPQPLGR